MNQGYYKEMHLEELWIWFGASKNHRRIPLHQLAQGFSPKHASRPPFHAVTGCNQASFFTGKGERTSWKTWDKFDDLANALQPIFFCPSKEEIESVFQIIERFVVLLYDRISMSSSINNCRKELFSEKGRLSDGIPPTKDAFLLHTYRAIYQASYCWSQSLCKIPSLPDPYEWGWKMDENKYEIE